MKNQFTDFSELKTGLGTKELQNAGPVVTISRECGCSAKRIATKLAKILTGYSFKSDTKTDVEWRWVSKEIIEEAARELEMNPDKVKNVFLAEKKIPIQEVTTAFSTEKVYDAADFEVINTVGQVIKSFAQEGHYIIVGRGAEIFSQGIQNRLSIKLQAPLDWRVNRIMQISNMNYVDARDYVLNIDKQRDLFVEHVAGRKVNNTDFDVVFNYSTMLDDHIVDAIVNILRNRGIV